MGQNTWQVLISVLQLLVPHSLNHGFLGHSLVSFFGPFPFWIYWRLLLLLAVGYLILALYSYSTHLRNYDDNDFGNHPPHTHSEPVPFHSALTLGLTCLLSLNLACEFDTFVNKPQVFLVDCPFSSWCLYNLQSITLLHINHRNHETNSHLLIRTIILSSLESTFSLKVRCHINSIKSTCLHV